MMISRRSEIPKAMILAIAIRRVMLKIWSYAASFEAKSWLVGRCVAKYEKKANPTIQASPIRYILFAVFFPQISITTSLIEKMIGRRNTATLTLSSLMNMGPNQKDILSPTGMVLIPNISARRIQNT